MAMNGWVDCQNQQIRATDIRWFGRVGGTSDNECWVLTADGSRTVKVAYPELCRRIAEAEEAKPVEAREPSTGPTKARLEDMSFEKLFDTYANCWESDAQDTMVSIIAVADERVARAFEQGRAVGLNHDKNRVPVRLILSDDGLRNSSIEQLLAYRDAYWSSLWGHLSDKESKRVIAELQRRIDAKPEQVVRLRNPAKDRNSNGQFLVRVYDGNQDYWWILTEDHKSDYAAKEYAVELVSAINPSARIEWENET